MNTIVKAEELFKTIETFILSGIGEDGYPLTKAVVPAKHRESLTELYFITNTSSKFATAVSQNPKASVYFYSKDVSWDGCYLKGDMEIVTDLTVKEKFWDETFKEAYAEQSFTDPDFCLLKFVTRTGRLYSDFQLEDFSF
jgi:general stress protein 26